MELPRYQLTYHFNISKVITPAAREALMQQHLNWAVADLKRILNLKKEACFGGNLVYDHQKRTLTLDCSVALISALKLNGAVTHAREI